jgi:hypothetical protein
MIFDGEALTDSLLDPWSKMAPRNDPHANPKPPAPYPARIVSERHIIHHGHSMIVHWHNERAHYQWPLPFSSLHNRGIKLISRPHIPVVTAKITIQDQHF